MTGDLQSRLEKHEGFVAEAFASYDEYLATGLHLTGQEMFEWLDTWNEERREAPPCHI